MPNFDDPEEKIAEAKEKFYQGLEEEKIIKIREKLENEKITNN